MISLALSKAVIIIAGLPPIIAVRLPTGELGATLRSLCDLLGISQRGQIQRIRRNQFLAQALRETMISTPGGPQHVEVLLDWAIAIWAAGLHVSRLSEAKQAAALVLQQQAFSAIEHAFADERISSEPEYITSVPPPPSQATAPQSVWRAGHAFLDHLEAEDKERRREVQKMSQEQQETRSRLAAMAQDQQDLKERVTILEGGSARPVIGASPQRLAHLYLLANRVRQRHGYSTAKTLEGLLAHLQITDVYDLPESAWPAILEWFDSLLEG